MRRTFFIIYFAWLSFVAGAFCVGGGQSGVGHARRILVIHSYDLAFSQSFELSAGFLRTLADSDIQCTVEHFELEAEIVTDPAERLQRLRPYQSDIQDGFYDVVVAVHHPAYELLKAYSGPWPAELPVVFIGLRALDGPMPEHIPEITGNIAPQYTVDTVKLARQLYPARRDIVMVADMLSGNTINERQLQDYIAEHHDISLHVFRSGDLPYSELISELHQLEERAVLLYLGWKEVNDKASGIRSHTLSDICSQVSIPVFVLRDAFMQYGVMGGVVSSGAAHGIDGAERVLAIIRGQKASAIPIADIPGRTLINWRTFQSAGLPESRLPAGVELLNRPEDFWTTHRRGIILATAIVFLVLLSLVALAWVIAMRNRVIAHQAAIYLHLPVRFMIVDEHGDILYTEHGRGAEKSPDLRGVRNLRNFWDPVIRDQFMKIFPEVVTTGESRSFNFKRGGRLRTGTLSLFPPGVFKHKALLWISQDTQDLQLAMRDAQESATRFALTLQAIGDAVVVTDAGARITVMNPVAEGLTGWTAGEAMGRPLDDVMQLRNSKDDSAVQTPITQALHSGERVDLARYSDLVARNGSRRHIADSAAPILDRDRQIIGAVMVFRDVTEEYRLTDELQRRNFQLQTASQMADMVYIHGDVDEQHDGGPGDWKRRTTVEGNEDGRFWPVQADGRLMHAREWVNHDDIPALRKAYAKLRSSINDTVTVRYRAGACVGRERHYEARACISRQEHSGRLLFFGIIRDVTAEEETKRLELDNWRVFQELLDNLPIAVGVKDIDNQFRYVVCNKYFRKNVNFGVEDIIGRNDDEIGLHPDSVELFNRQDAMVVESGQPLSVIESYAQPDGGRAVFQKIKTALTLPSGARYLISSGVDITEQHNLLEAERVVNECLSVVAQPANFHAKLDRVVEIIARQLKCDRVTVGRFVNDGADYDILCEYAVAGILPLSQIPGSKELICKYYGEFAKNELQTLSDTQFYDGGTITSTTAARSLLAGPIFVDGELWGSIAIAFVQHPRHFTAVDEDLIRSATQILAMAQMQQRRLNQLAAAHRERALILNNINIPIMLFDAQGRLCLVNTAVCELTGRSEEEILHGKCWEMFGCGCKDDCPVTKALQSKRASSCMHTYREKTFIMTSEPILDDHGAVIYVVDSAFDVTELSEARRQQAEALAAAQAADRAKSYFLATMSHEIRTPLNSVIGFTELLQTDSCSAEERRQYLEAISLSGRALLLLINDVLDLSKLEAGQTDVTLAETDVLAMIDEMRAIFQPKARQKGLDFVLNCPKQMPPLMLDGARCRQILFNLIGNALKFTHYGKVIITVALTPVKDTGQVDLRIVVSDTGIGIAEDFMDRLFMPFMQEDMVRGNRQYEGTGLGLTISSRLAKRMGGELVVESHQGEGSIFTFHIPVVQCVKHVSLREDEAVVVNDTQYKPGDVPLRALLVDDVPLNLKLLSTLLQKDGVSVVAVGSAQEALAELEHQAFDVVMTDLWMPNMNGAELANAIREQEQLRNLKIYAVTADIEANVNFDFAIFDGVIIKPITRKRLRQILGLKEA